MAETAVTSVAIWLAIAAVRDFFFRDFFFGPVAPEALQPLATSLARGLALIGGVVYILAGVFGPTAHLSRGCS